jgi:hypothetical protein
MKRQYEVESRLRAEDVKGLPLSSKSLVGVAMVIQANSFGDAIGQYQEHQSEGYEVRILVDGKTHPDYVSGTWEQSKGTYDPVEELSEEMYKFRDSVEFLVKQSGLMPASKKAYMERYDRLIGLLDEHLNG